MKFVGVSHAEKLGSVFMGIGSSLMPLFGMQFRVLNPWDENSQPVVGIMMAMWGGSFSSLDQLRVAD